MIVEQHDRTRISMLIFFDTFIKLLSPGSKKCPIYLNYPSTVCDHYFFFFFYTEVFLIFTHFVKSTWIVYIFKKSPSFAFSRKLRENGLTCSCPANKTIDLTNSVSSVCRSYNDSRRWPSTAKPRKVTLLSLYLSYRLSNRKTLKNRWIIQRCTGNISLT